MQRIDEVLNRPFQLVQGWTGELDGPLDCLPYAG
jgi:hypothetical protein